MISEPKHFTFLVFCDVSGVGTKLTVSVLGTLAPGGVIGRAELMLNRVKPKTAELSHSHFLHCTKR